MRLVYAPSLFIQKQVSIVKVYILLVFFLLPSLDQIMFILIISTISFPFNVKSLIVISIIAKIIIIILSQKREKTRDMKDF